MKNYDLEFFNLVLDFYAFKNFKYVLKIKSLLKEIFDFNEFFKKEYLVFKGGMF